MHSRLLRASTAVAATVAILGGSLMMAPAADAATHKISSESKHIVQTIKVGSHKDKLALDAATKKSTLVTFAGSANKQYVATKYKLTLKNPHKKVIFSATASAWRAINLSFNTSIGKYKTDAALVKSIKADLKKSEAKAKAEVKGNYTELFSELALTFVNYASSAEILQWISKQDAVPATFDGFTLTQPTSGVVVELIGTPASYSVKATLVKNGVSLTSTSTGKSIWSSNSIAGRLS